MTKQFRIITGKRPNLEDNEQVFDENVYVSGNLSADGDLFVSGTLSSARLRNDTGSTTTVGEVVYISGDFAFNTAENDGTIPARRIVGFTAEQIASGSFGKVVFNGTVPISFGRQLGTSWTAGDPIYLKDLNQLTTTPAFDEEIIRVGYCLNTPSAGEDALLSINIDARDRAPTTRLQYAFTFNGTNGGPDYGTPVYIDSSSGFIVAAQADDNSKNVVVGLLNQISSSGPTLPFIMDGAVIVTSSIQNGTTWDKNDIIYLSTVGGELTNVEPENPGDVKAQVGIVLEETLTDLETGNNGALVKVDIKPPVVVGADAIASLVNNIGTTCTQGEVVHINGDGTFDLADASALSTAKVFGLNPLYDISAGSAGDIATEGSILIPNARQNGTLWAANDDIYLSTTAGELTNLKPTGSGEIACKIGICSNFLTSSGDAYVNLRIEPPKQNTITVTSSLGQVQINASLGNQFQLVSEVDTEIQAPISGAAGDLLTLSVDNVSGSTITFNSGVQNYGQLDVSTVSGSKSIVTLTGRDYGSGLVWGRHVTHSENLFNGITDIDIEITTSNSTPTTIASYSTQADNSMYLFDLSFSMVDGTAGHVFERYLRSTFYRNGSSVVTQSNLSTISNYADDGSWDAYLEESGQDVLIRVVGDGTNVTNIRVKGVAIATES